MKESRIKYINDEMRLYSGKKGSGKIICAVKVWWNSTKSIDKSYEIILFNAKKEGYDVVWCENSSGEVYNMMDYK